MIKIINQGRTIPSAVFYCDVCGCEFEADISDCIAGYRCDDSYYVGTVKCPCLSDTLWQDFSRRPWNR